MAQADRPALFFCPEPEHRENGPSIGIWRATKRSSAKLVRRAATLGGRNRSGNPLSLVEDKAASIAVTYQRCSS